MARMLSLVRVAHRSIHCRSSLSWVVVALAKIFFDESLTVTLVEKRLWANKPLAEFGSSNAPRPVALERERVVLLWLGLGSRQKLLIPVKVQQTFRMPIAMPEIGCFR